MGYHSLSAATQDSRGIRLYETALSMRERDYWESIPGFNRAIGALEEELVAAPSEKRGGILKMLYDCYQRVWVGTIATGNDSATYYGNRTVEIARELEYSGHKAIKTK